MHLNSTCIQSRSKQATWSPARHGVALSALFSAVFLSACGGGGGGSTDVAAASTVTADPTTSVADTSTATSGSSTSVSDATTVAAAPAAAPAASPAPAAATPAASPAPTPAPAPAAAPATPTGVNLTSYGAACDGRTDDTAAIVRGLADAKSKNVALVIPAKQCNFSDVIRVDGAKVAGYGDSSVLYATNWQKSAIFMSGASPSVSGVKLTGVSAPSRQAAWEMTKITVFGATDFVIDHVTIEGSPAAGIQTAEAPTRGTISNNVVRNTLADSIHMTDGASYITVENNLVEYSGDDGIAIVSYKYNTSRVNNITARNNIVRNNKFGRNMSIVGGSQVLYENNLVQGNSAGYACLYIAQEASYNTWTVLDAKINRNTLQNCGSKTTGHAAAMVFSDGTEPNNNITLLNNDIIQSGQDGIRYYGTQTNIRLDSNRITGAGTAYVGGSDPDVTIIQYTSGAVGYVAP